MGLEPRCCACGVQLGLEEPELALASEGSLIEVCGFCCLAVEVPRLLLGLAPQVAVDPPARALALTILRPLYEILLR
eukprot:4211660-Lingulodinium_polyedra.AAC.1